MKLAELVSRESQFESKTSGTRQLGRWSGNQNELQQRPPPPEEGGGCYLYHSKYAERVETV